MISKRIKFIASLISSDDKVLDVGTDHALLPIYLIKNSLADIADGSDISSEVLKNAKKNISKYSLDSKINLYVSDGLKSVSIKNYNTLVITGMGFFTIKSILNDQDLKNINKMIIQSNNNHEELRRFINSIGFKIVKDAYILDKGKTYLILLVEKGKQKLSDIEYVCGLYSLDNIWYYKYIVKKYKKILNQVPDNKDESISKYIKYFNVYLTTEKTEE